MAVFMLIIGLIAVAAIVLALCVLGLAASGRQSVDNQESFADRIGVALFDMANSLFISRVAGLVALMLPAKQKHSA